MPVYKVAGNKQISQHYNKTALESSLYHVTRVRPMRRKRPMSMFRCFQPKIPMSDADVDFVYGSVVTAAGKMLSADAVVT